MTKYIMNYSGGATSTLALVKLLETVGKDDVEVVFADTGIEDPDLYRFMEDTEKLTGLTFTRLKDQRTPFTVFWDLNMFATFHYTPCSKLLKRERIRAYLQEKYSDEPLIQVFGYTGDEPHRIERIRKVYPLVAIPLEECFFLDPCEKLSAIRSLGLKPPRLYEMGFSHNNCGGFCVMAGQAHFANLLDVLPEKYAEAEAFEEKLRQKTGKNIAILKRKKKPYTLREHRERIEQGLFKPRHDDQRCSCFLDEEAL